jgi:hypothetical protein
MFLYGREIKMKPITPDELKKEFTLPDKAIEVINKKIIDCFTGYESIINKEELTLELNRVGFCNNVIRHIKSPFYKFLKGEEISSPRGFIIII